MVCRKRLFVCVPKYDNKLKQATKTAFFSLILMNFIACVLGTFPL